MLLAKEKELHCILLAKKVNLWKLRELALSEGGLLNGMYVCARHLDWQWLFACLFASNGRNSSF